MKITRRQVYIGLGVVVVAVVAIGIFIFVNQNKLVKTPAKTTPETAAEPTTPLDPLTIEAIRARTYTASPITTEQQLGNQGGYSDAIISYKSDGYKIYALQSTPTGTPPAGGWPVIIFDHGYIPPTQYQTNDGAYRSFIAPLAQAGFMVIKIDYRGHGKSEGSPEGGHFSPAYAYDNLNLIASLKQYPGVNAGRIGLAGHSLGAHAALRTIVASKDIKATVLVAGVVASIYDILYSWPTSPMALDQPMAQLNATKQALLTKYGDPKANPTFWNSVSAINYVDYISGKTQIHHAAGDSVVPLLFSQKLTTALQAANKPVEYYSYPGDDHQFSINRALFIQRMVAFYKANL